MKNRTLSPVTRTRSASARAGSRVGFVWLRLCGVLLIGCLLWFSGCASTWPKSFAQNSKNYAESRERMLSMARLMERHGNYQEAQKLYQAIVERDPENQTACHRLGSLAVRRGEHAEALAYFARAANSGSSSAALLNDVGYTLYLQNQLTAAEETLREALTQNAQFAEARNNLGLVLAEQKRFDEALAEFRKVGDDATAHSNLAFVQIKVGALTEAQRNFHRALELNPNQIQAGEALVQISAAQRKTEAMVAKLEAGHVEPNRAASVNPPELAAQSLPSVQPPNHAPAIVAVEYSVPKTPATPARPLVVPATAVATESTDGFVPPIIRNEP